MSFFPVKDLRVGLVQFDSQWVAPVGLLPLREESMLDLQRQNKCTFSHFLSGFLLLTS